MKNTFVSTILLGGLLLAQCAIAEDGDDQVTQLPAVEVVGKSKIQDRPVSFDIAGYPSSGGGRSGGATAPSPSLSAAIEVARGLTLPCPKEGESSVAYRARATEFCKEKVSEAFGIATTNQLSIAACTTGCSTKITDTYMGGLRVSESGPILAPVAIYWCGGCPCYLLACPGPQSFKSSSGATAWFGQCD